MVSKNVDRKGLRESWCVCMCVHACVLLCMCVHVGSCTCVVFVSVCECVTVCMCVCVCVCVRVRVRVRVCVCARAFVREVMVSVHGSALLPLQHKPNHPWCRGRGGSANETVQRQNLSSS